MSDIALVHEDNPSGILRRRKGTAFTYIDPHGHLVRRAADRDRIRALAIPPAWTEVWISPRPNSHLQATGRDARGRKQYRYHPSYRAHQEREKFAHLIEFAKALPRIRNAVGRHMQLKGLPREKVIATVVHLLETTLIRVGNEDYAKSNHSYGLTTLRNPHVDVVGSELRFGFKGKSGRTWRLKVDNRRVAKIVKACQDLPGQHLFEYCDSDGAVHKISSSDVNAYLKDVTGRDITAKDFRTWAGTVLASMALREFDRIDSEAAAKRNIRAAIESVAAHLGNTPIICRKCYVHPAVIESYIAGDLADSIRQHASEDLRRKIRRLKPEEAAVLALLQARLQPRKARRRKTSVP